MDFGGRAVNLEVHFPWLANLLERFASVIEAFAILILLLGALRFAYHFLLAEWRLRSGIDDAAELQKARIILAHYILSALEVFIVADLIMLVLTMALENLLFLALLVIVRTGISYFLESEIRALQERD